MKVLFLLALVIGFVVANGQTDQTGQTQTTLVGKLGEIAARFDADEAENFDSTMELIVGHLMAAPIVLATDGDVLTRKEAEQMPGALIDAEDGGPTGNPEDAERVFQEWCNDIGRARGILNGFKSAAHQAEALDLLERAEDMARNFHDLILGDIQRNNTRPALGLVEGQERLIENSAALPFKFGRRGVVERTFQSELPLKGGAVVLKEFAGIRAYVVCRFIPIWAEPWTSRRRLIGYRRVYHIRYYPCEYLKSIIYDAEKDPRVHTMWHCDRGLLSFWNYPVIRG